MRNLRCVEEAGMHALNGVALAMLLLFSLPQPAPAQNEFKGFVTLKPDRPVPYATLRRMAGLMGLTFIDVEQRFLVIAQRRMLLPGPLSRGVEPPWRLIQEPELSCCDMLHFYHRRGTRFYKLAEYEPGDGFYGMSPEHDLNGDRLFTSWAAGSSESFAVFGIVGSQVKKLIEGQLYRGSPEFIALGNDGEMYMVVSDGAPLTRDGKITYPKNSYIYAWDGKQYVLKKTVPWEHRFEALKERWPQEYPKE